MQASPNKLYEDINNYYSDRLPINKFLSKENN